MPRDATGVFTRSVSSYQSGAIISSEEVNQEMDDIATALTQSLNTSGTARINADISMQDASANNHRHTNVAAGNNRNHYADVGSVQDNRYHLLSGVLVSGTTLTAVTNPIIPAYVNGQIFIFNSPANTSRVTHINLNTKGLKPIIGKIAPSSAHAAFYYDPNFYIMPLTSGVVFPSGVVDNDLLAYVNGTLAAKKIGTDIQAFSTILASITTNATASNAKKLLKYSAAAPYNLEVIGGAAEGKVLMYSSNDVVWGSPLGSFDVQTIKSIAGGVTWNRPSNFKAIKVTLVGGGGGAGGTPVADTRGNGRFGFSGGGGESVIAYIPSSLISGNLTVIIGRGGNGGGLPPSQSSEGADGTAGGATQLKHSNTILLSAAGGAGGGQERRISPRTEPAWYGFQLGGAGGETTTTAGKGTLSNKEIIRIPGEAGQPTLRLDSDDQLIFTARGGDTIFKGGAKPREGTRTVSSQRQDINGNHGISNTGGGGGGSFSNTTTGARGGNGASGIAIIETY